MRPPHRVWAEIDLAALRHNLARIRRAAGRRQVWPVLKANAYGHGAVAVARTCAAAGAPRLGVGDSGEALDLREGGIETPLLVLGTVIDAEVPALLRHRVEVGVHSESRVRMLGAAARRAGVRLGVHLKIDTGMGRLGVRPEAAVRVARAVAEEPALELRGVMTHYASPDGCLDPATAEQTEVFRRALAEIAAAGLSLPPIHAANSAVLFTAGEPFGDAVRPGIALYGILPSGLPGAAKLRPVLSLRAQIVFLKDVPAGTPVGYGGRWRSTGSKTRLAVLPIGYNDGLPYRLGAEGRGAALVRGRRCPIVGAISMDYCTIDVSRVEGVQVGDVATLVGGDGDERIRVQEVAEAAGTIPYEITCSLGARVRRIPVDRTEPAAAGPAAAAAAFLGA
ncbi:MAG: alanine racemase [Planctomycetota bacterium]|nr:MAG: alanine racemase [Planctomycetota bacterium]